PAFAVVVENCSVFQMEEFVGLKSTCISHLSGRVVLLSFRLHPNATNPALAQERAPPSRALARLYIAPSRARARLYIAPRRAMARLYIVPWHVSTLLPAADPRLRQA
ncbi:MAG: hypothetical protein RIM23_11025, partial [Coleofasciculus sp. G3-WIS-01]|uniref:hypothetical protein n=1 Tax=Coleofasciculus sp. G3-WIS-01 TaxID=3069528 RepID=UPI0032FEA22A